MLRRAEHLLARQVQGSIGRDTKQFGRRSYGFILGNGHDTCITCGYKRRAWLSFFTFESQSFYLFAPLLNALKALIRFQKSTSGIDSCDGVGTCAYDDDERTCSHEEAVDCGNGDATICGEPVDLKTPSKMRSIATSVAPRAIYNPQNLPNLRSAMPTPARHTPAHLPNQYAPVQGDMCRGQILGVRTLRGQVLSPTRSVGIPATPSITPCAPSYAKVGCELGPSNDKSRDSDRYYPLDNRKLNRKLIGITLHSCFRLN